MSTVARRFCSLPSRLSSATWKAISELVCGNDSAAATDFAAVSGIASSLINDRLFEDNPLVVTNKGPRIRVYCIYGDDAISGEDKNEQSLSWNPTAEEWRAFLPCAEDEFEETVAALKARSAKFTAYNIEKGIPGDLPSVGVEVGAQATTVDWRAFKNL